MEAWMAVIVDRDVDRASILYRRRWSMVDGRCDDVFRVEGEGARD